MNQDSSRFEDKETGDPNDEQDDSHDEKHCNAFFLYWILQLSDKRAEVEQALLEPIPQTDSKALS